ncbi:MAG: hypothetical protein R2797_02960 [Gelidibacter sp.]
MTQIKRTSITTIFALIGLSFTLYSQTNDLTSSPYSLFGLGVESNSNVGRASGMGFTGISLDANQELNLFNSASFASIPEKKFIFDVGFYTQIENLNNGDENELRFVTSFSNLAMAFNANGKYGIGLSLLPATNVGYSLIGLQSHVEGSSNETYSTDITGSGGLNDVRLDYARPISKNFNLGLRFSYLFGKIEETENALTSTSLLTLETKNYYSGVKFGLGAQYTFWDKNTIGIVLESPSSLSANRDFKTTRTTFTAVTVVDETTEERISNFKLPFKFGLGFNTYYKKFLFAFDYKRNFWDATNQSDEIGEYVDQNIFSFGAEYTKNATSYRYWNRINFRAGFNYDSGNLEIDGKGINSKAVSLGIGFPLDQKGSKINFSYNYKKTGSLEGILIQDHINTININLSLTDFWFEKRKYD